MKPATNLYIIIAEDDFDDGELIQESFEKHPAFGKVLLVNHGQELLDVLHDTSDLPDVILTDINMPVLSGIDALKEIYDDSKLQGITSFVYSTTINPIYEAKCNELGVMGFLIKPASLREFEAIPQKIVDSLA